MIRQLIIHATAPKYLVHGKMHNYERPHWKEFILSAHSDFDFLVGDWNVHNRRLKNPLTGSGSWYEFEGASKVRHLWGGIANMDEYVGNSPEGLIQGGECLNADRLAQKMLLAVVEADCNTLLSMSGSKKMSSVRQMGRASSMVPRRCTQVPFPANGTPPGPKRASRAAPGNVRDARRNRCKRDDAGD